MGIPLFFKFWRDNFRAQTKSVRRDVSLPDLEVHIDNLMLDLNGPIHTACQKAYKYGSFAKPPRLLGDRITPKLSHRKIQTAIFEDVCAQIVKLLTVVQPQKRLIICIDGPAPLAKQCLVAGTPVTLPNGSTLAIDQLPKGQKVLGWNGQGFSSTMSLGCVYSGEKDTVNVHIMDSRVLTCTRDHPFLTARNGKQEWVHAGKLRAGDRLVAGVEGPTSLEGKVPIWKLLLGQTEYTTESNLRELQALCRMLGYVMSDGYVTNTKKSTKCAVCLGTRYDANGFLDDVELLTNKRPLVYKASGDKGIVFQVTVPAALARSIVTLEGMPIGKRVTQPMSIPTFLCDPACPNTLVREFLGGLFGGDGCAPSLYSCRNKQGSFSSVSLTHSISEHYTASAEEYFGSIADMLYKVGVTGATLQTPQKHSYTGGRMIPKDIITHPRLKYVLRVPANALFVERVGFRYAINKSMKLSVASAYWRMSEASGLQKTAYCKGVRQLVTAGKHTTRQALEELATDYPGVNLSVQEVHDRRRRGDRTTTRRPRGTMDGFAFVEITGTALWFVAGTHAVGQEDETLPSFTLPVKAVSNGHRLPVYDIEVSTNHSFLAHGICVHNCQQRKRRYKSAMEASSDCPFDSNSITPGTDFMDKLGTYIDWFIRKSITSDSQWRNLEVLFSSDRAAGEGEHKCAAAGTKVLLWNGSVKNVEDIQVGDTVIGDDGAMRTVTSLVSGKDEMYEVCQNNADNYTVNKGHILSLQVADHRRIYWSDPDSCWVVGYLDFTTFRYRRKQFKVTTDIAYDEAHDEAKKFIAMFQDDGVLDITVEDYLNLPKNTKNKLYGFRCPGVLWPSLDVRIDPYLLGLWLGDGCARNPLIYSVDPEVIDYLTTFCNEHGYRLGHNDKYIGYSICEDSGRHKSLIREDFRHYDLFQNKHIPRDYKTNDVETRLQVLAGIIDTDGNVTKEGRLIRIAQSLHHKRLVDDIVYLARSLGFCVNVRQETATYSYLGEKRTAECYQVTISGDLHRIPTRIVRKKCSRPPTPGANGRSIVVDKLRTSIKDVRPVGQASYYGFNTDGNHRFLLHDFTVTHNCLNYIRFYGDREESFCINGCDADLIMLALGTHLPEMYILREDPYDDHNEYFCLDIGRSHEKLASILYWEPDQHEFIPSWAVNDFIFLCFMVGNDFLPHIPSVEIIENGVDVIIQVYKEVCSSYGHITSTSPSNVNIENKPLSIFMATIGHYEKELLDKKLTRKGSYFPDPLLENCAEPVGGDEQHEPSLSVDITAYRKKFCDMAFPSDVSMEEISHQYLEGMQWVLTYYLRGVPSWRWMYPYHYAPPAHILAQHVNTFVPPTYPRTVPSTPFQQLLCVLPPKSAPLIPSPLGDLICTKSSPLKEYCPDDFKIDLAGKRKEWEGIVLLPIVNYDAVCAASNELLAEVDPKDLIRNSARQTTVYVYDSSDVCCFVSKQGNIKKCKVRTHCIDI